MSKKEKSKKYSKLYEIIKFVLLTAISIFIFFLNEKVGNMATKQDIGAITEIVEEIKADIKEKEQIQNKRREIYTELSKSMKIFINGSATSSRIEEFYNDYASIWLWANDETIIKINGFIDIMLQVTDNPGSIAQDSMRKSYTECMIAMRKEIYSHTKLKDGDFKFLRFD